MRLKTSADKLIFLMALIFIFQGLSIAILSHPLLKVHPAMRLVGVGLFVLGTYLVYYLFYMKKPEELVEGAPRHERLLHAELPKRRPGLDKRRIGDEEPEEVEVKQGIVTQIMSRLSGRAKRLSFLTFPIIGALIIDAVFMYNFFTGQGLDLNSWDIITIMLGASLIAYNFIPEEHGMTRDFIVFFLAILFIILIFPQLFYSFFVGDEASARYTQILLANPTSGLLNIFGIETTTYVEANTAMIEWGPSVQEKVGITEACSGIYTTSIFISAFVTYILVEYQKINAKVIVILIIGILTSYLANILRMAIITGIGKLYGTDALLSAHANAGWLIFLAWIIPFWYLVFRYLIVDEGEQTAVTG